MSEQAPPNEGAAADGAAPDPSRQRHGRRRSAADRVRGKDFPAALRGYERAAVDAWKQEIADLVERLEEQAPRDAAVKRALDEVGQETAAILQRAHEAADEITTRSRSQADGRLQRAEREAEEAIRDAEEGARRLEADARAIWDQRARLIDDMRTLADDVLGVAEDAAERLEPPWSEEEAVTGEQPAPARSDDDPTVEAPVADAGATRGGQAGPSRLGP